MFYLLQQTSKELFHEKTRIILTILAITWGTFTISGMLAVGEGLRVTFGTAVANVGKNLLMVRGGRTSKIYAGIHTGTKIDLKDEDAKKIAQLPNIAEISPQHTWITQMRYKNITNFEQILPVQPNFAKIREIRVLPGGRFLSPMDVQKKNAVIVLGTDTLQDFFPNEKNPVGKYIYVGNKQFRIVGIMKPKTQIAGHREPPDAQVNWIPISVYEATLIPKKLNSIVLTYKDPALLPQLQGHIQQTIALDRGADPSDDNILHFTDYAQRQTKITGFFLGMQIFLGIIGVLTLLVAGVGIANVMYASVNRATHEIGIRMAIGARTYQIVTHYVMEALTATFIGGALGLLMSALLVYGLQKITFRGRLFEIIGQPHPVLSLNVVLIVIVVLGLTGFFAGLFPALKASRVDPSEALSYE